MNPSDAAAEGAERPPDVGDGASGGRREVGCDFEPPADGPQAPPLPPSGVPGGQSHSGQSDGQPFGGQSSGGQSSGGQSFGGQSSGPAYGSGRSPWASWMQPEGPFGSLSKTAMILSIAAVVSLFTPLNSLSWAAAVGGIVLGFIAKGREPEQRSRWRAAILIGFAYCALVLVMMVAMTVLFVALEYSRR